MKEGAPEGVKSTNSNLGRKRPPREEGHIRGGMAPRDGHPGQAEPEAAGTWLYGELRQEVTSPGSLLTDSECAAWLPCQH